MAVNGGHSRQANRRGNILLHYLLAVFDMDIESPTKLSGPGILIVLLIGGHHSDLMSRDGCVLPDHE